MSPALTTASRRKAPPSYRFHQSSGQAVVTLNGKDFYLGTYGTPESRHAYAQLIAEWSASDRQIMPVGTEKQLLTVSHIIAGFLVHAEAYYVTYDGQPATELNSYRQALRPLKKLYGTRPARKFGPLALAATRQAMIETGWARKNVNKQVNRIRSVFKWAASQELIPAFVCEALRTLAGLQPGRGGARETAPVRPVPIAYVDGVKPFVSEQVWALIQLQLLTGARAGELVRIRPIDIDTAGDVLTFSPPHHKTAHHGHKRIIYIGPKGQEIVRPYLLGRPVDSFLFSAAEAEEKRRKRQHEERETPLSCGNVPGSNRKVKPKRTPREHYDVAGYRRAIARACEEAFAPPEHLCPASLPDGKQESRTAFIARLTPEARAELAKWRREHHWHPHQLRHNAATYIRREFGLEFSKVILGHRSLDMTQRYAEADQEKAQEVVRRIG
ncbi:MAG: site-specific tyrosine recombinase XerC [Phycisphaerales bacterium]|nr:site-specific tyrosine recombinase XerC [Phycisphaerales bacterium]